MTEPPLEPPVLEVRNLVSAFRTGSGWIRAVDGVSFEIPRGRTVALVGESGSGKSATALSIMGLLKPPYARITSGQILFRSREGTIRDLARLDDRSMRALRGNEIGMVFQDPMTSLNPTQTVGWQIAETLRLHRRISARAAAAEAVRLLGLVEIADASRRAESYPHHLSGGMRQRVMIAMALACKPTLLLADEPTTALDVTVQAQILRLIRGLQDELGMGVLFITHDMGVVAEIADRVEVMYAGQVVESAPVMTLFDAPRHPYTQALMRSLPGLQRSIGPRRRLPVIPGSLEHARESTGCRFADRCGFTEVACRAAIPQVAQLSVAHQSRCVRWQELA